MIQVVTQKMGSAKGRRKSGKFGLLMHPDVCGGELRLRSFFTLVFEFFEYPAGFAPKVLEWSRCADIARL